MPHFEIAKDNAIIKEELINMANAIGKRYICEKCGFECVVTRAGEGNLTCCGEPMKIKRK
jgi:desulfoferrodoxin-like iron-binding protein